MVTTGIKNLLLKIKPRKKKIGKYVSTKEIKEKYPLLYKKAGRDGLEEIIDFGPKIYKGEFSESNKGSFGFEFWEKDYFNNLEVLIDKVGKEKLEEILSFVASASSETVPKMVGINLLRTGKKLIGEIDYDQYLTIANTSLKIIDLDLSKSICNYHPYSYVSYLKSAPDIIKTFGYDELIDLGNIRLGQNDGNPKIWEWIFEEYHELRRALSINVIEDIHNLASLLFDNGIPLYDEHMKFWKRDGAGGDSFYELKWNNFILNVSSLIEKIPFYDDDSLKEIFSVTYDYAKENLENAFLTLSYSPQLIPRGCVKNYKGAIDFQKKLSLNAHTTRLALKKWDLYMVHYGFDVTDKIVEYGNQLKEYGNAFPLFLISSGLEILKKVGKDKFEKIMKPIMLISANNTSLGETILLQTPELLSNLGYEKTIKWYNSFNSV